MTDTQSKELEVISQRIEELLLLKRSGHTVNQIELTDLLEREDQLWWK